LPVIPQFSKTVHLPIKINPGMVRNFLVLLFICALGSCGVAKRHTIVSIKENKFYINNEITYKGRTWQGNDIAGLLFNSRMVQGIFDDLNPLTSAQFAYPDTRLWDADRNTREFIAAMPLWKSYGLLAFTLNLQGGSPTGYGNKGWINSAFDEKGDLRPAYLQRLKRILDAADRLGMVVILGYFYFGQDELLQNEAAVVHGVDEITNWLLKQRYKNVLVEINNETDISYDHKILQPQRIIELVRRVQLTKRKGFSLPVSTSFSGGTLPTAELIRTADFILLHGNGVQDPAKIDTLVTAVKKTAGFNNKPIVFNEDDHFNFEDSSNNFSNAIRHFSSWGYFDYRMKDEGIEQGYQSVPVDWGIRSDRKKRFYEKLKEITGY
jgi:hypothetical protein